MPELKLKLSGKASSVFWVLRQLARIAPAMTLGSLPPHGKAV